MTKAGKHYTTAHWTCTLCSPDCWSNRERRSVYSVISANASHKQLKRKTIYRSREMFGRNLHEAPDQPIREKLNYFNKGDYRLLRSDTRQFGTLISLSAEDGTLWLCGHSLWWEGHEYKWKLRKTTTHETYYALSLHHYSQWQNISWCSKCSWRTVVGSGR